MTLYRLPFLYQSVVLNVKGLSPLSSETKTRLSTTMAEEQLSDLAVLSIERDMASSLDFC